MSSDTLLLRPVDAAIALAVSRSRIYELIASGAIATVRTGTGSRAGHRIERAELERYIERERATAPASLED